MDLIVVYITFGIQYSNAAMTKIVKIIKIMVDVELQCVMNGNTILERLRNGL